jgi:tetratricopeptide (TPR) repeat protein
VLTETESTALLKRLLGRRATQEPDAVADLAARCAHLPLALRIAAANLLNHPQQTVTDYTAELHGIDRLDALTVPGDDEGAVRIAFDRSYRRLTSQARRLFRLLGLHPGNEVEPYAASALAATELDTTRKALDTLAGAHLLYEATAGRFRMHDLLRSYAAERVTTEEPEAVRHAAVTRLLDHYLHTAHAAMDVVYPSRRQVPLDGASPVTSQPVVADHERAMAWLENERTNLVAATRCATEDGWLEHAWTLPHTLDRFFYLRGYLDDWIATHRFALTATRQLGDQRAEAQTLNNLGTGYLFSGRYGEAHDHYTRALSVCRRTDDRLAEATTLGNLALLLLRSGRYSDAQDHFQQALVLHRQVADRPGEARVLNNLGLLLLWRGQYADAIDQCRRALGIVRQIGDRRNEAAALDNLSVAHRQLGHHHDALDHAGQALEIFRQIGDRRGEAAALDNLGTTFAELARHTEALQHHDAALAISHQLGVPGLTCEVLNHTGTSHRLAGRYDTALNHHGQALTLAHDTGERHEEARAHHGIARTYDDMGDPGRSGQHWHRALALYRELGVPEAEEVQAHLTNEATDIIGRNGDRRESGGK